MRYISFLFSVFVSALIIAQSSGEKIPSFILAKESKPLIEIVINEGNSVTHGPGSIKNPLEGKTVKEFETLGNGTFNALISVIQTELNQMGIEPYGFINFPTFGNLSQFELMNGINEMKKTVQDQSIQYKIHFKIQGWNKISKKAKKGDLSELKDLCTVNAAYIKGLVDANINTTYDLNQDGTLGETLADLSDQINAQDPSYFQSTVASADYSTLKSAGKEYENRMKITSNSENIRATWPSAEKLNAKEVLFVYNQKQNEKAVEELKERFPFAVKLITEKQAEEIDFTDYKFALVPQSKLLEAEMSSGGATKDYSSQVFYYALKDLKTQEMHYGPEPKKIIKGGRTTELKALRVFLDEFNQ